MTLLPPYNSMFGKISGPETLESFEGNFDVRCAADVEKAWRGGIMPSHFKDEVIALYDGEIRLVDDQLGRIFKMLKSYGVYDETVIVVVSDHGEVLFEIYENDFYKQGPGHTARYTDDSIHIPLIIKPATFHKFDKNQHIDQMVSTIDLVPTLLELLRIPDNAGLPGTSLVPALSQPNSVLTPRQIFFQENPYEVEYTGVRTDQWKFVTQ